MVLTQAISLWRDELNDAKSTLHPNGKRYKDEQFIAWVNQARTVVFNYRPQWFQKTIVVKLSAGSVQTTCDCNKFYAVDGLADCRGNITKPLVKQGSKSASFFPPAVCAPCVNGVSSPATTTCGTVGKPVPSEAGTYSFDANIPNRFIINPPIPESGDYFARVVCANPPPPCCVGDECCMNIEEYPAVGFYVKAMASLTLKESTDSQQQAKAYFQMFFQLLGVTAKADKEYYQQKGAAV